MAESRKQLASWRGLELYACIAYAVLFECFVIWRTSATSNDFSTGTKAGGLYGLKPGWIGGRQIDLSDSQWRNFRSGLPALTAVMAVFSILGASLRSGLGLKGKGMAWFWLFASLIYVIYLHGNCVLFILAIGLGNYVLTKNFAGIGAFPALLWTYNILFLVSNRVYEGYKFESFGEQFAYLDKYRGEMRWHISFNMVMLRLVSYGLDCHWAQISRPSTVNWENHTRHCHLCTHAASGTDGAPCYLSRQEKQVREAQYNLVTYLAYILYAPLYLAGPIITFNAFSSQLEAPQKAYNKREIALYGLRWLLCFLLMELLTHRCYFNALAISGVWQLLSPVEIFIIGYGVLNFMWLKFLLIWRFFRLWALIDGIETQENMVRCLNNCYDLEGFWKSWHASYNRYLVSSSMQALLFLHAIVSVHHYVGQAFAKVVMNCNTLYSPLQKLLAEKPGFVMWKVLLDIFYYQLGTALMILLIGVGSTLLRYLYIPLGGSKWRLLNVWIIFTFVAIWHDLEWKLLSWAWVTCILWGPELLVKAFMRTSQMSDFRMTDTYRECCALAGSLNITGLMMANLVGFVVGPKAMKQIGSRMCSRENIPLLIGIIFSFYIGSKIMLAVREHEEKVKEIKKQDVLKKQLID